MYAVRRWDEEVIKMAVAMCLAMVGLMVMPVFAHIPSNTNAGAALMYIGMEYRRPTLAEFGWTLFTVGTDYIWSPGAKIGTML